MLVLAAGVLTVLLLVGFGVYFVSEWVSDRQGPEGPGSLAPGATTAPAAQPLSTAGFAKFLDSLEKETGSTIVTDATLYPTYAVAVVPEPGDKGRSRSYYYDGNIRQTGLGTTTSEELDLRQLDPELFAKLVRKTREQVEEPTMWYVTMRAPDPSGAVMYAYASNAYGEGGYVAADLQGKIVTRVTW